MSPKITSDHLRRGAVVYVRQSTLDQVLEHTESKRRQYALADSGKDLGFVSVSVIDNDLGRSGSNQFGWFANNKIPTNSTSITRTKSTAKNVIIF